MAIGFGGVRVPRSEAARGRRSDAARVDTPSIPKKKVTCVRRVA